METTNHKYQIPDKMPFSEYARGMTPRDRNLLYADLVTATGLHYVSLSRYAKGSSTPTLANAMAMSRFFNKTPGELFPEIVK